MVSLAESMVTDVLVIGAGVGGIRAAIGACDSGLKPLIVTKGVFGRDGAASWMAGPGFEAVLDPLDSVESQARDIITAGKYINNQRLVCEFMKYSPQIVEELDSWGFRFAKQGDRIVQIQTPANSFPRGCSSARRTFLGTEYRKVLPRQVHKRKIDIVEDCYIAGLITRDNRVIGALAIDLRQGVLRPIVAKVTILATGGYSACYEHHTGNQALLGEGHAMAFRAGAELMDMEFVQFIPTVILWPTRLAGTLVYELVVQIRGIFYNGTGERFMERYYPEEKDFVPRGAQARAIYREVKEGRGSPHGGVYLSLRHLPRNLIDEFVRRTERGQFWEELRRHGVDLYEDGIEVYPACHFTCGGLQLNEKCRTTLEGLYAVGEVGSGGKDGAERLAGNAITYAFCMGIIAGREAASEARETSLASLDKDELMELERGILMPIRHEGKVKPYELKRKVRGVMSAQAFLGRTGQGLAEGIKQIEEIKEKDLPELYSPNKALRMNADWVDALEARNMLVVAEAVLRAALTRKESRGLHEREDYPYEDSEWLQHIFIKKEDDKMVLRTEHITDFPYVKPPL